MTWQIVAIVLSTQLTMAFALWLRREQTTVAELKAELAAMAREWTAKFERHATHVDAQCDAITKRMNALTPSMNPLGSSYSTKRPG